VGFAKTELNLTLASEAASPEMLAKSVHEVGNASVFEGQSNAER